MEAGNILSADVLDIIFEDRNKAYGAYDLRKNYHQRLAKSLIVMALVVILLLITYMLVAAIKPKSKQILEVETLNLENVVDKKKLDPPPVIPPPVKQEIIEIKTKMFTKFLISHDDKVPDNEKPPEQTELVDAKIGVANRDGKEDDGLQGPPVDEKNGVVDAPKKQDEDVIFKSVEIESQYPGGLSAWSAFVYRNLVYPQEAIDDGKQGTVYVQFIVDTEGNVSDVKAVSGPEELYTAAVSVIKKSGKWTAAIQNGRKVKSYKKQPITFKLAD